MIPPVSPDARRSEGRVELRYEDITQDGFLRAVALPHAMGKAFWQAAGPELLGALRSDGIVPILHRWCCRTGDGPLGLHHRGEAVAHYELAHCVRDGAVDRIVLRVWTTMSAKRARVHGPPPPGAGELIEVGQIYAEHVFTRLFAPPGQRRVVELDAPHLPRVPALCIPRGSPDEVLELPEDAAWTSAWEIDPAPVVFGIDHTDSNQHVNSLAYPQLFRDVALRGWMRRGRASTIRLVSEELLFRKPCFAGDRLAAAVRTFERAGHPGAALALLPIAQADGRLDRVAGSSCHVTARVEGAPVDKSTD